MQEENAEEKEYKEDDEWEEKRKGPQDGEEEEVKEGKEVPEEEEGDESDWAVGDGRQLLLPCIWIYA